MALDAGYGTEEISDAVYPHSMSWWGEESAMWAEWMERFDRLRSHEDERIQKVGELGTAKVETSRDKALSGERQEAIYGIRYR